MPNPQIQLIQSLLTQYDPSDPSSSNTLIPLTFLLRSTLLGRALQLLDTRRVTLYSISNTLSTDDSNVLIEKYGLYREADDTETSFELVVDDRDEINNKLIHVDLQSWFCSCYEFNQMLQDSQIERTSPTSEYDEDNGFGSRRRNLPQFKESSYIPLCHHLFGCYLIRLRPSVYWRMGKLDVKQININEWLELVLRF